jgi:nitrogen-specific signal transduction histidine kinase
LTRTETDGWILPTLALSSLGLAIRGEHRVHIQAYNDNLCRGFRCAEVLPWLGSLLPHVFDMFVQGAAGIERSQGGLGLGLSLVQTLVALHDGTVSAQSEGRGRGSEFVVRLPVSTAAAARARHTAGCGF